MHGVDDGINSVRATLPHCWFAEDECSTGIRHLKQYRKDWDAERGTWKNKPRHDNSSNCADAFRYLSMAWREVSPEPVVPTQADIVREVCRPRTWNDLWRMHTDEQYEASADDLPEYAHEFNLNNAPKMD